ncbi:protein FAM221A-like isoform X2 [Styela clava]
MDSRVHLKLDRTAGSSIDAYLEYKRIVGDDDNGKLFTPEEYEEYKRKVLPLRSKNRLYVSWSNSQGMDCKIIGPETKCFCQHRYRQHQTDFESIPETRPIHLPCKVKNCSCRSYEYIPTIGSQPIRCHCKHFATDHSAKNDHQCTKPGCTCQNFTTSFNCGCGEIVGCHSMIVETKEERFGRGHPVAREEPGYAAMGGITGFSSLIDGYMRLDDSGVGAPPLEWLEQPTTSSDHPFLRAYDPKGLYTFFFQYSNKSKTKWYAMMFTNFCHCYDDVSFRLA